RDWLASTSGDQGLRPRPGCTGFEVGRRSCELPTGLHGRVQHGCAYELVVRRKAELESATLELRCDGPARCCNQQGGCERPTVGSDTTIDKLPIAEEAEQAVPRRRACTRALVPP